MRELETQSKSSEKKFTIIDVLKVQSKEDLNQVSEKCTQNLCSFSFFIIVIFLGLVYKQ